MSGTVRAWRGDLTTMDVDAVVSAANESLSPGGGVCGAIFAAAGPELVAFSEADHRRYVELLAANGRTGAPPAAPSGLSPPDDP